MTARHSQAQQAQLRALLMPIVKAGNAVCWRCKQPIGTRQHWDAGHLRDLAKDPSQAQAPAADLIAQGAVKPEHRTCNRRAGARAGNKARGRRSRAAKSRFSETAADSTLR